MKKFDVPSPHVPPVSVVQLQLIIPPRRDSGLQRTSAPRNSRAAAAQQLAGTLNQSQPGSRPIQPIRGRLQQRRETKNNRQQGLLCGRNVHNWQYLINIISTVRVLI